MFIFDLPRPELIDYLSKVVTNRDLLNKHVRELQTIARGPDAEVSEQCETENWSDEELDAVLSNGLDTLSDERLAWLRYNPMALFELYDAINESLPPRWNGLVFADANRLWEERPKAQNQRDDGDKLVSSDQAGADDCTAFTIANEYRDRKNVDDVAPSNHFDDTEDEYIDIISDEVVTNRDALVEHVRKLLAAGQKQHTDSWPEDELQRVLNEGLKCLPDKRKAWLKQNPIALFELFDAISECLPACWLETVLGDAKRLWDSRPGRDQ